MALAYLDPEERRRRAMHGEGQPDMGFGDINGLDSQVTNDLMRNVQATAPASNGGGGIPWFSHAAKPAADAVGSGEAGSAGGAAAGSKLLSSGNIMKLLLGGMSMFGGPQQQFRSSFAGNGSADPVLSQQRVMDFFNELKPQLMDQTRQPKLRSPFDPATPAPGLQVGGAFGMDPALRQRVPEKA